MARTGLTREVIVRAARTLLEQDGPDALSMRRLATALGTSPMTLYHYVPGRSELLNAVLDQVAAEIDWRTPTGAPEDRMLAVALQVHEVLGGLPWVVEVLRDAGHVGASALVSTEQFLTAAIDAGADPGQALSLWRSVWFLIAGDLVLARSGGGGPRWYESLTPERVPDTPTVRRLLPRWAEYSAGYDLGEQLRHLIDGTVRGIG
jgi:AcrR family transcriptional regulator